MLIDSHTHLADKKFARDLDRVLARARDTGIERLICIADDLPSSRDAIKLASRYPALRATVGIHPHHARGYTGDDLEAVAKLAQDPKVVAIGEVGLDFHYPDHDKDLQERILIEHASLASDLGLPLVLHCRDAYPELIDLFRRETSITSRGVVHCFSGSYEEARDLIELGFYLGIGGTVTYPNGKDIRETVARIGLARILSETDAPYLPPQKRRGRRNEPSYMKFVISELAGLTGFSYQDVAAITAANARRLFGLEEPDAPEFAYEVRDSLYLNVTNECTNECCFCERTDDFRLLGHYLKLPGEPSAEEILATIDDEEVYDEVVICGLGEPTLRFPIVLQLAKELKSRGHRLRLNTNGHGDVINGRSIGPELAGVFDSVAVMMIAHNAESYKKVACPVMPKASFEAMLDFTREVKRHVPDVRMRAVALPEVDIEACRRIAEDELKVRFQVHTPRAGVLSSTNGNGASAATVPAAGKAR